MRVLIIGGGRFLGRSFAAEALAHGDDVVVFNRGRTSVDLPGVSAVRGDRGEPTDVARLAAQGPWDAVIDTCASVPGVVGQNARALAGQAGAYLFVSSVSAFADWPARPLRDGMPLLKGAPDATEGDYGALKAGAERAVRAAFPGRSLVLYPGLIIGPYENQGRQTWWLSCLAQGGLVVAPGDPRRQIRLIDARDVARFGLHCLRAGDEGSYVVTSPPGQSSFGEWLGACAAETGAGAELVWAGDTVLQAAGVDEWTGLPLWSAAEGDARAVWDTDVSRALAAGLVCRPVRETVRDTWRWLKDAPVPADAEGRINGHGLPPRQEQQILKALGRN